MLDSAELKYGRFVRIFFIIIQKQKVLVRDLSYVLIMKVLLQKSAQ